MYKGKIYFETVLFLIALNLFRKRFLFLITEKIFIFFMILFKN